MVSLPEAIEHLKSSSEKRKFSQSVDLVVNLANIDLKKPENKIDLYVQLHHDKGKKTRICGLVGPELLENSKKYFVLRAPYAYPIYFKDYKVHLNNLFDYADSIGSFKLLGRSGRYLYMDMDYCIIRAFDLAEEVLKEIKNGNGIKD